MLLVCLSTPANALRRSATVGSAGQAAMLVGSSFESSSMVFAGDPVKTVAGTGTEGNVDNDPTNPTAVGSQLAAPDGLAFDSHGNLYIADGINDRVRKVTPDGAISTVAGTGVAGDVLSPPGTPEASQSQLSAPRGIAFDDDDNMYIADSSNHRVVKVTAGGAISVVAGTGVAGIGDDDPTNPTALGSDLTNPGWVAISGPGELYISDTGNHRVRKVDTDGFITTVAGTGVAGNTDDDPTTPTAVGSQLDTPAGVVFDADGNLYIADRLNSRVRKVSPSGGISTYAGTGTAGSDLDDPTNPTATGSQISMPVGLAFEADSAFFASGGGGLFIAEWGGNKVRKVDAGGGISTVAGTGVWTDGDDDPVNPTGSGSGFAQPTGLALDGNGMLHISDAGNDRVRVVGRDRILPQISIASPSNGLKVAVGKSLQVEFSCSDLGGSDLASCTATVNGSPVTSGSTLDTSVPATLVVVVLASDGAGNDTAGTRTITVEVATTGLVSPGEGESSGSGTRCGRALTGEFAGLSGPEASAARLYMAAFLRQPDKPGHEYWVGKISEGHTFGELAYYFYSGQEFQETYGALSDSDFVELLYENVMCRSSDAPGKAYWLGELGAGAARSDLLVYFSESPEFKTKTGTS